MGSSQARSTLAVLFADLCGSTELYERLGDEAARAAIRETLALLGQVAEQHGGRVVKEIGDEVLCAFPSTEQATEAAVAMHLNLDLDSMNRSGLRLRSAYHWGQVIEEQADVFGDTVNVAARLVALSAEDQILTSQPTIDSIPDSLSLRTRRFGKTDLKGKEVGVEVVEVLWRQDLEDLTDMPEPRDLPFAAPSVLLLAHGASHAEVSGAGQARSVSLGRSSESRIRVDHTRASRRHATIEMKNGRFYLREHSANGTIERLRDGSVLHVHREVVQLPEEGWISLGKGFPMEPEEEIHFELGGRGSGHQFQEGGGLCPGEAEGGVPSNREDAENT